MMGIERKFNLFLILVGKLMENQLRKQIHNAIAFIDIESDPPIIIKW